MEAWCWGLVTGTDRSAKLTPPPCPDGTRDAAWEPGPPPRRLERPGRPPGIEVVGRAPKAPRPGALARPAARAQLLHTFVHHELQAAELFAWAALAFPDTPRAFRAGLVRLAGEELEHLALYRSLLRALGGDYGDHPVRDWFWERVPGCPDAASFVALLGVGLEGANLEHTARYTAAFRAAGDEAGARTLERVERDEIAHVAFAVRWFPRLTGQPLDFARWRAALPPPLTPALFRGRPLNRAARARAGLGPEFLARLEAEPDVGGAR